LDSFSPFLWHWHALRITIILIVITVVRRPHRVPETPGVMAHTSRRHRRRRRLTEVKNKARIACLILFNLVGKKRLKKIVFVLLLAVCFFPSCEKVRKRPAADPWAAYRKAYTLLGINRDSAFLYFNRLAENSKDRQQVALSYYNMALLQSNAGDHYGAQESLALSLKSLDENRPEDRNYLASDYNELSMACFNLQDFPASLAYSEQALKYAVDPNFRHYILNNKGNALQKLKRYDEAVDAYSQVMLLTAHDSTENAKALTNVATTKWLKDPAYNAAPDLHAALAIRLKTQDTWGQNSSYAHLSDFFRKKKPDSALVYAQKMLRVAEQLESPDDKLEAIQKLILLSPPAKIKTYYLQYQALNDSIATVRRAAKNQFALIRYGVEKNKAENLTLQKANTERTYQLGLVLLLMVFGATFLYFWYRKRKRQQELDKQNAVDETRKKASKQVHDTLANDIYQIMKKVQHARELDRELLVDDIDEVYQRARDISYEITQRPDENFHETISGLLRSFATDDIKVILVGNSKELWQKTNDLQKLELKYVLQELMVNMRKHSGATDVIIKFQDLADYCMISYFDNGCGIPEGTLQKNGLKNTGNRIKGIGGEITFDPDTGKGLQIQITFPIA
jgi:signal transduction histidine kinase